MIKLLIKSSDSLFLKWVFKSIPDSENKHVTNLPSVDIRALEHDVQNGLVTGAKPADFFYDFNINITGFDIKVGNLPAKTVKGNRVSDSPDAVKDVRSAGKNTSVVISKIKASMVDGKIVTPNYVVDTFFVTIK